MTICINKRYYSIPTEWNELSGKQLAAIMEVFYDLSPSGGAGGGRWSPEKSKLRLLQILTGMSRWRFFWANVDEMADHFYLLEFLMAENTLTRCVLPEYDDFYGPADGLGNIVVSEYVFTESHYQQWRDNNTDADLNSLCAVLYRPAKWGYDLRLNSQGDARVPFNENLTGYYASRIRKWPMAVKLAIVHFYEGCRGKLLQDYEDVFGGSGEPAKRGMLSLVVSMAETGTFGEFDKVEKMYLQTFMIGLSEAIEKSKQMEKQTKTPNSNY